MLERGGAVTNQLDHVIHSIRADRKSGYLKVESVEHKIREKGIIVFVDGAITQAAIGQRRGEEVLEWLSTWGTCRCTFVPSGAEPVVRPLRPFSAVKPTPSVSRVNPPPFLSVTTPVVDMPEKSDGMRRYRKTYFVPSRIKRLGEALSLLDQEGLPRIHRHLLLLIDGRRSTDELGRLMGRKHNEVQELVRNLERVGVIQL